MLFSPYLTSPHGKAEVTGSQLSIYAYGGIFPDEASNPLSIDNKTTKSWSAFIPKDKTIDSEARHFFTTESSKNVDSCGGMTSLSTSPDEVLSADIGTLLLDMGCL